MIAKVHLVESKTTRGRDMREARARLREIGQVLEHRIRHDHIERRGREVMQLFRRVFANVDDEWREVVGAE